MSRAVLLTAAATVAAGYYLLARKAGDDDDDDLPSIAPETIAELFDELTQKMTESVGRMMRSIQEHKSQGNMIPEQYLQQVLVQNFESTLAEAQEEVFRAHGVDDDDLQEAVEYYQRAEHKEVCAAVEKFQQLYMQIGGSIDADLPDDLDVEQMCQVLEEYMEALLSTQEEIVKQAMASGRPISAQEMQQRCQKPVQEKTMEVLSKYGLSQTQLQTAIKKYSEDPAFTAKIKTIEEKQAQRMQAVQQLMGGGGTPFM